MNLTQLFQKMTGDEGVKSSGKPRKGEPLKKDAQKPSKPRKAETPKRVAKKPEEKGPPWWERFQQYLREVVYELRRVVWPSRKETIGSTSVVLVIVILSGVFLGFVDLILSRLMRLFVG